MAIDLHNLVVADRQNDVSRRFIRVEGRVLHYRVAGAGPAVVMLHDSPRSSRLHLETMRHLSNRFRVYALDTPGYGNSEPLDNASPTIGDFAEMLGATLGALGLGRAPIYATHTSAKIALEHAARSGQPSRLILDGLSIPQGPADSQFIQRYMRAFEVDPSGAYLAAEWTRMRDMLRWFPWFDQRPETRMAIPAPSEEWICDYIIDFFAAGASYSSAYAAAMNYDPMPALLNVSCSTLVAAKEDDVLYQYLDRVPLEQNRALTVERLSPDNPAWLAWLEATFAAATTKDAALPILAPQPVNGPLYVDLRHGSILVHRCGPAEQTPLLILSAPTTLHALRWQQAFAGRTTLVPELPGFGESAPLPHLSLEAMADALDAMIGALEVEIVDVLAIGFATPLGAHFAARHPAKVRTVILDGCFSISQDEGNSLCPQFPFDMAGGHIHRYWHMLRDGEANWPWRAQDALAHRLLAPLFDAAALHDALVGILKQPAHYGDAVHAGCIIAEAERYPTLTQPVMIFERTDDRGYAAANDVATRLPSAKKAPRPATIDEAAAMTEAFLIKQPILEVAS